MLAVQKSNTEESEKVSGGSAVFVKVSMDGAPYLRKVDLKMYKSYQDLSDALAKMFSTIGNNINIYNILKLQSLINTIYILYIYIFHIVRI